MRFMSCVREQADIHLEQHNLDGHPANLDTVDQSTWVACFCEERPSWEQTAECLVHMKLRNERYFNAGV